MKKQLENGGILIMTCKERFLKYIAVSTASDEDSTESPSTTRQLELSRRLAEEMLSLGLTNVHMDSCGNAIGTLPATEGVKAAGTLALIAHVDTSPAASGEGVNAREVLYTGEDIELGHGVILSEKQFPAMKDVRGQVLLVTDGSTLLGADDKAGVAEIMTAVEKLIASGAPHGELRIVFTTDEEVGRGTEGLDVKELACDWGYTVDGGELGVYEYENFNAAAALVRVHGVGIHPGSAKNIMKNAATIAMELHSLLPADEVPEKTEGYEGFFHLTDMSGTVEKAMLSYIIRDHNAASFDQRIKTMEHIEKLINEKYGEGTAKLTVRQQYRNMRELIGEHMEIVELAERALRREGIEPVTAPVRGGTDGSQLTFRGLLCPNIGTGGYSCHGPYEHITAEHLETSANIVLNIIDENLK